MPVVTFGELRIPCEHGANLRKVIMRVRGRLYHPLSRAFHCRGLGTCGTCAVKLRGSASWPTKIETLRLCVPPHRSDAGLRLACQVKVHGDLVVEKFAGIWGSRQDRSIFEGVELEEPNLAEQPQKRLQPTGREEILDRILFHQGQPRVPTPHSKTHSSANGTRRRPAMSDVSRLRTENIRFKYHFRRRSRKRR